MLPMSHILVVDDEPIIRMLLEESLGDAGYSVTTATNGAEALATALAMPADIVLLDLLMPDMDGFSFLRERQAHPRLSRVPVIVLSAAGLEGLREASLLRATALLAKPLNLDVLSTVIEYVLRDWSRETTEADQTGRPIGVCPICKVTVFADLVVSASRSDRMQAVYAARVKHVLSHSAADIAGIALRQRLLELPSRGRGGLASWFYRELRRDWGDNDTRGVHSIDAALDSPALHRLWQDAIRCNWSGCRHQP
jgi:CheY-like chemotaxis protein